MKPVHRGVFGRSVYRREAEQCAARRTLLHLQLQEGGEQPFHAGPAGRVPEKGVCSEQEGEGMSRERPGEAADGRGRGIPVRQGSRQGVALGCPLFSSSPGTCGPFASPGLRGLRGGRRGGAELL